MTLAVARARSFIGVRFRLQGRDPATGLDCVGLVLRAFELPDAAAPDDYGWRVAPNEAARWLGGRFTQVESGWSAGDVLLATLPRGRLHLALWSGDGMIHADAALGRICERAGVPEWLRVAAWRLRI